MASWRTFLFGMIGSLGIVLTQIGYGFDENPDTTTNWDLVIKTIGAILSAAGIFGVGMTARDDGVSTEEVKASKKKRNKKNEN